MRTATLLALPFLLVACGGDDAEIGETCGGYTADPMGCAEGLSCCQPDPRIADIPGTCIDEADLSAAGETCGAVSGLCCAPGLWCDVQGEDGEGTCQGS